MKFFLYEKKIEIKTSEEIDFEYEKDYKNSDFSVNSLIFDIEDYEIKNLDSIKK